MAARSADQEAEGDDVERLLALFRSLDTNGDGRIEAEELKASLQRSSAAWLGHAPAVAPQSHQNTPSGLQQEGPLQPCPISALLLRSATCRVRPLHPCCRRRWSSWACPAAAPTCASCCASTIWTPTMRFRSRSSGGACSSGSRGAGRQGLALRARQRALWGGIARQGRAHPGFTPGAAGPSPSLAHCLCSYVATKEARMQRAFRRVDTDHSGTLEAREVQAAVAGVAVYGGSGVLGQAGACVQGALGPGGVVACGAC